MRRALRERMRLFLISCLSAMLFACGGSDDSSDPGTVTEDSSTTTNDTGSTTVDDTATAGDTTPAGDTTTTSETTPSDAPVTSDAPADAPKPDAADTGVAADATPGKCDMVSCPMGKKCCASSGECVPTPPPPGC
jgi:hypothetical protein